MRIKNKTIAVVTKIKSPLFEKMPTNNTWHRIDFTDGSSITVQSAKYLSPPEGEVREFEPDWASAPGETITELMQSKAITTYDLANRLGFKHDFILELISGKQVINSEMAERLSKVLGGTPQFWMNRERNYRDTLTRLSRVY